MTIEGIHGAAAAGTSAARRVDATRLHPATSIGESGPRLAAADPSALPGGGSASPELCARFEAAMERAGAEPEDAARGRASPIDPPSSDAPLQGAERRTTAMPARMRLRTADEDAALVAASPAAALHLAAAAAIEPTAPVSAPLPVSATAAAALRLQAAPMVDRSAPWHIAFSGREVAATGVSGIVVTPGAAALPPSLRVVASASAQPALALRVDGLRARLERRGLAHDAIAVSEKEGDDDSQG